MTPGDVVLIRLPQVGAGPPKLRPALVLSPLPGPFQNSCSVGSAHNCETWNPIGTNWSVQAIPTFPPPDFAATPPSVSVTCMPPKIERYPGRLAESTPSVSADC